MACRLPPNAGIGVVPVEILPESVRAVVTTRNSIRVQNGHQPKHEPPPQRLRARVGGEEKCEQPVDRVLGRSFAWVDA